MRLLREIEMVGRRVTCSDDADHALPMADSDRGGRA